MNNQSIGKAIEVYQVADWRISFNQSVPQQEMQALKQYKLNMYNLEN